MKSVRVINGAVNIFERIKTDLSKGVEIARKEQEKREKVIAKQQEEHEVLEIHVKKANKVLENLGKILD